MTRGHTASRLQYDAPSRRLRTWGWRPTRMVSQGRRLRPMEKDRKLTTRRYPPDNSRRRDRNPRLCPPSSARSGSHEGNYADAPFLESSPPTRKTWRWSTYSELLRYTVGKTNATPGYSVRYVDREGKLVPHGVQSGTQGLLSASESIQIIGFEPHSARPLDRAFRSKRSACRSTLVAHGACYCRRDRRDSTPRCS